MARDIEGESDYYKSHGGIIPVKWTAPEVRQVSHISLVLCRCPPSGGHFSVIVSHLMLMRPGFQNCQNCTLGDSVYSMLPFCRRCDCMYKLATINSASASAMYQVIAQCQGFTGRVWGYCPRTRFVYYSH